jgi:hypothetical protein
MPLSGREVIHGGLVRGRRRRRRAVYGRGVGSTSVSASPRSSQAGVSTSSPAGSSAGTRRTTESGSLFRLGQYADAGVRVACTIETPRGSVDGGSMLGPRARATLPGRDDRRCSGEPRYRDPGRIRSSWSTRSSWERSRSAGASRPSVHGGDVVIRTKSKRRGRGDRRRRWDSPHRSPRDLACTRRLRSATVVHANRTPQVGVCMSGNPRVRLDLQPNQSEDQDASPVPLRAINRGCLAG